MARLMRRPSGHLASGAFVEDSERFSMALPFDDTQGARDPRALAILAKTIYRELRGSGYTTRDVVALAGELVGMVATDVRGKNQQG